MKIPTKFYLRKQVIGGKQTSIYVYYNYHRSLHGVVLTALRGDAKEVIVRRYKTSEVEFHR